MATSATYLLPTGCQNNQRVCFYISCEGYPADAAAYFHALYQFKNIRGGYAESFLRANNDAEFAADHSERKDTGFRYAIDQEDALSVWKKSMLGNQWRIIYQGPWYQFLNTYLNLRKN